MHGSLAATDFERSFDTIDDIPGGTDEGKNAGLSQVSDYLKS